MLHGNVRNLLNKLFQLLQVQLNGTSISVSSCWAIQCKVVGAAWLTGCELPTPARDLMCC